MTKLLIGADPEFFVKENNTIIPAVGMVSGTKYQPLACLRGAMQVDGLALEFNIDPAETEQEFDLNVHAVMRRTIMEARKNTGKNKLKISKNCFAEFSKRVFEQLPEEAKELGCSASYTPYDVVGIPRHHVERRVRVAGGHIHLGWVENNDADTSVGSIHFRDCVRLASWLDTFVQARLARHLRDNMDGNDFARMSTEERRRKNYYGKFGEFRCKPYGMEYRSLSNFWIHSSELRRLVFKYTQEAFQLAVENPKLVVEHSHKRGHMIDAIFTSYCWEQAFGVDEYIERVNRMMDSVLGN